LGRTGQVYEGSPVRLFSQTLTGYKWWCHKRKIARVAVMPGNIKEKKTFVEEF